MFSITIFLTALTAIFTIKENVRSEIDGRKKWDCHNITETFTVLSNPPESIDETQIASIENYLMSAHCPSGHKYLNINEARIKRFFNLLNPDLRSTIISRAGFNRGY